MSAQPDLTSEAILADPLMDALVTDARLTATTILSAAPADSDEVALVATAYQMGMEMALALAQADPAAGGRLLDAISTTVLHLDEASLAEREHVIQAHYLRTVPCPHASHR